jgi:hypothetical protein
VAGQQVWPGNVSCQDTFSQNAAVCKLCFKTVIGIASPTDLSVVAAGILRFLVVVVDVVVVVVTVAVIAVAVAVVVVVVLL